jgi:hypothetical protein
MDWVGACLSVRVLNVTWIDLDLLAFISTFWIARKVVYSSCQATALSLSLANTTVSSTNILVVDSVEVGGSAVYRRYNSGPRTLLWGAPH